jgi:two-component system phosphate regulon response regulator PhoB
MARILVIEDDPDIQTVLDFNLRNAGHAVTLAAQAGDGLRLVRETRPDLVLLDLMLPDMPGTEVCKAMRQDAALKNTCVLMLTAKGEEIDRVVGFAVGADDYVVKPFSVRELLMRVAALLRRAGPSTEDGPRLEFGVLSVDREAHRAWVGGELVELTALEFKLLITLHDRKNRVQTRARLLSDVWGIDAEITTRTVDTHVKRLREKLGVAGDYVQTVRGVGYRFAERPEAPPSGPPSRRPAPRR